jgi:hypothetical protein
MFQFLQPFHIGGVQPPVLGLPLIVGGGADPVFPPDLVDGATGIGFFQNRHDLRFSELRLAHGNHQAKGSYRARKFSFWTVYIFWELTDHGREFQSRALEDWAYRRGVQLDFIRPGKPVENAVLNPLTADCEMTV